MFSVGSSMTDKIIVQKDGGVGHIRLNQPEKLNAISYEMWQGMARAIDDFESDDAVRVIVLSGRAVGRFLRGRIFRSLKRNAGRQMRWRCITRLWDALMRSSCRCSSPRLQKLRGIVLAGGLLLRCVAICGLRPMIRLLPFPLRSWAWIWVRCAQTACGSGGSG